MRPRLSVSNLREALRVQVLAAALKHVPFDGWTWAALERGALESGRTRADAHRAFPDGAREAIALMCALGDARMTQAIGQSDLSALRFRERVAAAVMARLATQAQARDATRHALAYLVLPGQALLSARLLWHTVDALWRAVGDRSTDFSFYTKRATLAAVYAATLLVWLDDTSDGLAVTRAFLDRRIEGVMRFGQARAKLGEAVGRLPDAFALIRRLRRAL
ncbi:MAG: COQ9 family protein [Alphaproteobacteria bacterium]|nr:COQ9 family protein [Alphaproteobacteria bacterium]